MLYNGLYLFFREILGNNREALESLKALKKGGGGYKFKCWILNQSSLIY